MPNRFSRTTVLVGDDAVQRLARAHVAVFGLGGVGGYALEALARAGVGRLFLVDCDSVEPTNINRQILALDATVGRPKVDVARERVLQINPNAHVTVLHDTLRPGEIADALPADLKYAVDAIDSVAAKVDLIATLHTHGVKLVSSMGTGSKLDTSRLRLVDISKTHGCPLARTVRKGLSQRGITKGVRCVFSEENLGKFVEQPDGRRRVQGTVSYMPGMAGLMAAGVIISDIVGPPA